MSAMRPLSEAECYARCYGWRSGDESVRVLPSEHRYDPGLDPRFDPSESGERLRRLLELRIDAHEPEAA